MLRASHLHLITGTNERIPALWRSWTLRNMLQWRNPPHKSQPGANLVPAANHWGDTANVVHRIRTEPTHIVRASYSLAGVPFGKTWARQRFSAIPQRLGLWLDVQ